MSDWIYGSFENDWGNAPRRERRSSDEPEFYAGYLTGYRMWSTMAMPDGGEVVLLGHAQGVYRARQRMEASCSNGGQVPCLDKGHSSHGCGMYALKLMRDLHGWHGRQVIVCRVAIWGRIIEHELGYRAQYCYPLALVRAQASERLVRAFLDEWEVVDERPLELVEPEPDYDEKVDWTKGGEVHLGSNFFVGSSETSGNSTAAWSSSSSYWIPPASYLDD